VWGSGAGTLTLNRFENQPVTVPHASTSAAAHGIDMICLKKWPRSGAGGPWGRSGPRFRDGSGPDLTDTAALPHSHSGVTRGRSSRPDSFLLAAHAARHPGQPQIISRALEPLRPSPRLIRGGRAPPRPPQAVAVLQSPGAPQPWGFGFSGSCQPVRCLFRRRPMALFLLSSSLPFSVSPFSPPFSLSFFFYFSCFLFFDSSGFLICSQMAYYCHNNFRESR
jgi:hypothetical protein